MINGFSLPFVTIDAGIGISKLANLSVIPFFANEKLDPALPYRVTIDAVDSVYIPESLRFVLSEVNSTPNSPPVATLIQDTPAPLLYHVC
jgi:hypothetical protein